MSKHKKSQTSSLTRRVVWALTGTAALSILALCVFAYGAFAQMEDNLVNDLLVPETGRLVTRLKANPNDLPLYAEQSLGGPLRAWYIPHGGDVQVLPEPMRELTPGLHILDTVHYVWHTTMTPIGRARLYVRYDATGNEMRVRSFGILVLLAGLVCIAVAYLLSRRVAALAVAPIVELTERLTRWAPGGMKLQDPVGDEAGRLIEAFNRVQGLVEQSITHEREFASNLSHEIYTPLAAIRSDSELMLLSSNLSGEQAGRMRRSIDGVDRIVESLAAARELASQARRRIEPVELRKCMEDAWRAWERDAADRGLTFEDQIPVDALESLDRYALLMVLRNLVRNAIEHAAPALLVASWDAEAGVVRLRDNGKGITQKDLPFIFQRYYRGRLRDLGENADAPAAQANQRGLGLAIVSSLCARNGWRLEAQSETDGPHRGTTFILKLRA